MMLSLCLICGYQGTVAEMLDHAKVCKTAEVCPVPFVGGQSYHCGVCGGERVLPEEGAA